MRQLAPLLVLALAVIHIIASRLRLLHVIHRRIWLSAAGGASISYVFVRLLPELNERTIHFETSFVKGIPAPEQVYLLALVGLIVFYALEVLARRRARDRHTRPSLQIFWIHIGAFAAYNGLVGYLIIKESMAAHLNLFFFFIAMALHFIVNDYGLYSHHREIYLKSGRWVLGSFIIVGGLLARVSTVSERGIAMYFSLLAGAAVLNVLKEELPRERESNLWAFLLGAAAYSALLLLI